MPLFRPGKPWRSLHLAANAPRAAGAGALVFDVADEDGDWGVSTLTSSIVQLDGLYLVTFSMATTNAAPALNVVGGIDIAGTLAASQSNPTGFNLQTMSAAWSGQLAAGTAVSVRFTTFSSAKVLAAGQCWLTVTRIGPKRWT